MPYRLDPNTGQFVWDGSSIPQTTRDSLGTQIRELQAQIDDLSFVDLDDVPTTYTGQAGKILSVKSAENGLEFITNSGGGGGVTDGDKGDVVVSSSGAVWTLDTSGVTAGSYTLASVTVDAKGRVTAAANGSAVTAVSVTTANGISGTSSGGATPALTLTLGAITPSSVNGITLANGGSGALTVTGTASVSGTNTGDQTITLTGDVTGSGIGSFATTLANSGVTAGSYIRATITVDAKGRVTSATSNTAGEINGSAGTVDNAITRADGTGGSAVQGSSIVIDDIDATTQQNVAIRNVDPATNSAVVITPKGTGAFIVGPKPDGGTTGGGVRGTNAVDLQTARSNLGHIASGANSFVGAGSGNAATASASATIGGIGNQSTAAQSMAHGSRAISNRLNMIAHGNAATVGESQAGRVIMRRTTTDATPVPLSMDGAAPTGATITTSTHFILVNNQAVFADIRVVARSAGGTDHAAFTRRVLIKRDANAASTAIIGSVLSPTTDIKSAGATAWDVAITADTSNGGMLITVTGAATTTIVWGASVEFMEIIRA